MKTMLLLAMAAMMAGGCSSVGDAGRAAEAPGGIMGALQTADEALAARYGVPASVVRSVRSRLGIPDAREQPQADQILPAGWTWAYDLLDAQGNVVDPFALRWGDVPRLRRASGAGAGPVASVFRQPGAVADVSTLDAALQAIAGAVGTNALEAFGRRLP